MVCDRGGEGRGRGGEGEGRREEDGKGRGREEGGGGGGKRNYWCVVESQRPPPTICRCVKSECLLYTVRSTMELGAMEHVPLPE